MKRILFILALLICSLAQAQPIMESSGLRFHEDGSFRIVQFTDLHFNSHVQESVIALKRIDEVIDAERPDLVVLTGDIIYSAPAEEALRKVLSTISAHDVHFCLVFGNHDYQFDLTRGELYDIACSYPGCVMPARPKGVDSPDYTLPIHSHKGTKVSSVLYCIDSNAHLYDSKGDFTGYDFIHPEQVEWYRSVSRSYTKLNGGSPIPALAFFHIPLPEFHDAVQSESSTLIGTRMEAACAPEHNSGMFDAIKEMGDVMGVFVGHDHDDDYAVEWQDVLLAYGRFTGGNTEYNHLSNGGRIIVLKEGSRSFESYIRLKGGRIENRFAWPDSFVRDDWRNRPLDPECY